MCGNHPTSLKKLVGRGSRWLSSSQMSASISVFSEAMMYSLPFNFLNEQQTWSQRRIRKQPNKTKKCHPPPPKIKTLQTKNQHPRKKCHQPQAKIKTQTKKTNTSPPDIVGSNYQQLPFDSGWIDSHDVAGHWSVRVDSSTVVPWRFVSMRGSCCFCFPPVAYKQKNALQGSWKIWSNL